MLALFSQQKGNPLAAMSSGNGIEYKFITEPDDELMCLICIEVARDPLQHEKCGKLFFKVCLEKYGRDKPCPNCKQEKSNYYTDRRSKHHANSYSAV